MVEYWVVASSTGNCRANETLRVNKSLIRVVSNDESARSKLTIKEPKTEKSNRTIPISTGIMKEIKRFKIIQNEEKLKAGSSYEDNNLVFCTELGKPVEPRNLNRKFYRLIKKADIKNFNLHGLRHTYATMLLEQDIHPKVVQEALGHTKISTTLDIYSHVSPEIMRKAANALDKVYMKRKNPSGVEG